MCCQLKEARWKGTKYLNSKNAHRNKIAVEKKIIKHAYHGISVFINFPIITSYLGLHHKYSDIDPSSNCLHLLENRRETWTHYHCQIDSASFFWLFTLPPI
jgi:hypothetical protein